MTSLPLNNDQNHPEVNELAALRQLEMLGYVPGDPVFTRAINKVSGPPVKLPPAPYPVLLPRLRELNEQGYGIYFVANGGGDKDSDVSFGRAIFFEHDNLAIELQRDLWRGLGLPEPTVQIHTGGKSVHSYWALEQQIPIEEWRILQRDLLDHADADRSVKNPSRVMRLAGFIHPETGIQSTIIRESGYRYSAATLRARIPSPKPAQASTTPPPPPPTQADRPAQAEDPIPLVMLMAVDNRGLIESGQSEGGRNVTAHKIACDAYGAQAWAASAGIRVDGDWVGLVKDFAARCSPPLPDREVEIVIRSVEGSSPTPSLSTDKLISCAAAWQHKQRKGSKVVQLRGGQDPGRAVAEKPLPHSEAGARVAAALRWQLKWDPVVQVWRAYRDGVWVESTPGEVLLTVEAQIRELPCCDQGVSLNYCNAVLKFLQGHLAVKSWGPTEGAIPLKDGILSTATQQIRPYKPQDLITHQLPISWADRAKGCGPVLEWLNDAAGSPAVARLLLAWINAVVLRRVDLQRFLLLVGPGGSGKSTYLGLLRQMIGAEGVGATELSQLEGNRFELAALADKSLITISDQGQYRGSLDRLKGIVGQDPMRLERKGVQGSLSQPIRSMIVLAANELPGGSDTSSGIERRRLVVPFSKIVPPHERRDLDLEFRPFLAGLLAAALAIPTDEVTQLIRSTNTAIPALAQVHLDSLIETNSMAAWVDDCLTLDPSVSTPIGTGDPAMADVHLYASYVAFCKLSGSHPVSLRRFSPALLDLLKVQLRVKDIEKVRSKKGYTVTGIRIRSPHDYSEKIVSGVGSEVVGVGSVQGRCRVETQSVQEVHSVQGENAAEIKNEKKEAGIPDKTQEREENREKSDLSYTPNTSCTARVSTLHSPYTDPTPPYIADTLPVSVESTCEDMQDPIVEVQSETMKGLYREFGFSDAILIQDIETVTGILIKDFRWGGMSQGQYVQVYSCLEARIEAQATPEALES